MQYSIIVPIFWWYWGSKFNESWGSGSSGSSPLPDWNNRNNRDDDKGSLWLWILCIVMVGAMAAYAAYVAFFYKTEWDEQLDQARKYGTEQVLESTHSRAVKSVDTINFANYVMIPQKTAERDSARYSRKISRFINLSGTDYLYKYIVYETPGDGYRHAYYKVVFDKDAFVKEPKVQKALRGYEQSCQQLAARRKVYKPQSK